MKGEMWLQGPLTSYYVCGNYNYFLEEDLKWNVSYIIKSRVLTVSIFIAVMRTLLSAVHSTHQLPLK